MIRIVKRKLAVEKELLSKIEWICITTVILANCTITKMKLKTV